LKTKENEVGFSKVIWAGNKDGFGKIKNGVEAGLGCQRKWAKIKRVAE
jgi:hypothetical protein